MTSTVITALISIGALIGITPVVAAVVEWISDRRLALDQAFSAPTEKGRHKR